MMTRALDLLQLPRIEEAEASAPPDYEEDALFLHEPRRVFEVLTKLDWSFKNDETGFLAHDIHPYPAKFIPQIPGTLISRLSARGELVLDPFGGSGTTALEAVRLGRRAMSVDANPLSALMGRVKTASIDRATTTDLRGFHAVLSAEAQSLPRLPQRLIELNERYAPNIPNRERWYADTAFGEMCLVRARIASLESEAAKEIALVALSRVAIRASFQDSETRYKSVPREVPQGETLRRYLKEFRAVLEAVARNEAGTRYGICRFMTGDVRALTAEDIPDGSADLIVTSPPYGNATDYHLYHRFRLLWLGFDPIALGHVEIGSHLKHQRERSGFESYFSDLYRSVETMARVLRPCRYAALILGDSLYEGRRYDPAAKLAAAAESLGFDAACPIERPVHATKRSFTPAGRRAISEKILVLRRRCNRMQVVLGPPPYRLWPYERSLRLREVAAPLLGTEPPPADGALTVSAGVRELLDFRGLAFTHRVGGKGLATEQTWQAAIENGGASAASARKDPKYITHGLHAYKGKFYPQLAKGLLNLSGAGEGATLLDPFCGSGTTLLEGYLNGFSSFGCDMHPLAAKIARAKTAILEFHPDVVTEAVTTVLDALTSAPTQFPLDTSELPAHCLDEMSRWFPAPVVPKLNWLLKVIRRTGGGAIRDFLEVVLSSIVRDVSQQEPADLRIRFRKERIEDADVLGLFGEQLSTQYSRIEKFWHVRGRAPYRFRPAHVAVGDNRSASTFADLGLGAASVDVVLTSPPYATALPYIDTDRLSLLTLFGLSSSDRRPLDGGLTGSREISLAERRRIDSLSCREAGLPGACSSFVDELRERLVRDREAGFRKQNMPALLTRYMVDMRSALGNVYAVCKRGATAMIVIGDNKIVVRGKALRIPTTDLVEAIAVAVGFEPIERIDISVTTENLLHLKHAITENVVLRLRRK